MLKDRVAEPQAVRHQACAEPAQEAVEEAVGRRERNITPQALKTFARQARKWTRTEGGCYRDHLAVGWQSYS